MEIPHKLQNLVNTSEAKFMKFFRLMQRLILEILWKSIQVARTH